LLLALTHSSIAFGKVHVDPNGPAGQQYALPLDSARGQGAGQANAGVPGSTAKPPLFGQGIHRAGSNRQGPSQDPASSDRQSGKTDLRDSTVPSGSGNDDGSSIAPILLVALAIGGLGCGAGLIARRRLSPERHA
jgi:hypothetical protein